MEVTQNRMVEEKREKQDADYVFFELTRSICPTCRRVIDGHILLRDNKVYMRKRCPEHGLFEGVIYGDAEAYIASSRTNKPSTTRCCFFHHPPATLSKIAPCPAPHSRSHLMARRCKTAPIRVSFLYPVSLKSRAVCNDLWHDHTNLSS